MRLHSFVLTNDYCTYGHSTDRPQEAHVAYAIDTAAAIGDIVEAGAERAVASAIVRTIAAAGDELVTTPDLAALKSELKEDIVAVKEDMASFRIEVKEDIVAVKEDMASFRIEVKEEIAAVRADGVAMKTELKEDIAAVKAEVVLIRSSLTIKSFAAQVATAVATVMVVLAALRFLGT